MIICILIQKQEKIMNLSIIFFILALLISQSIQNYHRSTSHNINLSSYHKSASNFEKSYYLLDAPIPSEKTENVKDVIDLLQTNGDKLIELKPSVVRSDIPVETDDEPTEIRPHLNSDHDIVEESENDTNVKEEEEENKEVNNEEEPNEEEEGTIEEEGSKLNRQEEGNELNIQDEGNIEEEQSKPNKPNEQENENLERNEKENEEEKEFAIKISENYKFKYSQNTEEINKQIVEAKNQNEDINKKFFPRIDE